VSLDPRSRTGIRRLRSVGQLLRFQPSLPFVEFVDDPHRLVLLRAANRAGKTRHCAYVAARRAVRRPGSAVRVIGPTNKHAQTVLGGYIAEFVRPYLDPRSYHIEGEGWNGGREKTARLANGSYIEHFSLEDKVLAHSGSSRSLIVMDEPPTQTHYTENVARIIDQPDGQLVIAATMVNQRVEWLRKMVEGGDTSPTDGRTVHETGWVQYVAQFRREYVPWMDEEQVEFWLATMDASPWQKAQRVEATWDGGVSDERRFSAFTEDNVSDVLPSGKLGICLMMDHGEVAGRQIGGLLLYRGSRGWMIDEDCPNHPTDPTEDAHRYLALLRRHGIDPTNVDVAVGDINTAGKGASGLRVNELIMKAMAEILGRQTAPFRIVGPDKTPGSVDWGQRMVNYASRRGHLTVHPRCRRILQMMRHWNGKRTLGSEMGEMAHAADMVRYGITASLGKVPVYARLRIR